MHVHSVNIGRPVALETLRGTEETGLFKEPAPAPVMLRAEGVDGDFIGWLEGHGAPDRAVYMYALDHYAAWRAFLGLDDMPLGYFGENLTVAGLTEPDLCVGDRIRIGAAELIATCPRTPCYKFLARAGTPKASLFMLERGFTGIYFSVAVPGAVAAGDTIDIIGRDPAHLSMDAFVAALTGRADAGTVDALIAHPLVPDNLRDKLKRLTRKKATA